MEFSDNDIAEFRVEASDLLDSAEDGLLQLDRGGEFKANYDAVFRVFHSLKGGSGMLGLDAMQIHMHKLENRLVDSKSKNAIAKPEISFFLRGIDAARKILEGQEVSFEYAESEFPTNALQPSSPILTVAPTGHASISAGEQRREIAPDLSPSVFLIDDEQEVVDVLRNLLENAGIQVRGFTKAKEAIAALGERKPDAVISDYNMPELTGIDVLREIRQIDPDLPVIFVSGFLSKEILMDALQFGLYATIEKPFRNNEVILQCLNAARQYRLVQSFNRSMNLVIYQFPDLDDFLRSQGKEEIRQTLQTEIYALIEHRKTLKQLLTKRTPIY